MTNLKQLEEELEEANAAFNKAAQENDPTAEDLYDKVQDLCKQIGEYDRSAHYDRDYFTTTPWETTEFFNKGWLRHDETSVLWYALGQDTLSPFTAAPFEQQMERLAPYVQENPGLVLDVGCGRGMVAAALHNLGFDVWATDFSKAAVELTKETILERAKHLDAGQPQITQLSLKDIPKFEESHDNTRDVHPNTVIFCESIEHIPEEEFEEAFPTICSWHPRLIIAGKLHWHPMQKDNSGWNHIREINDRVYDEIASHGEVKFRKQSHLVVQL